MAYISTGSPYKYDFLRRITDHAVRWWIRARERRQIRRASAELRYWSDHMKRDIGWFDR